MNNEEELSSMLSQSFDLELPALVSREQIITALSCQQKNSRPYL
jgi:hypothetical protein